jgi:hypothetical protein
MKRALQRVLDEVYRRRFSLLLVCIVVFVLADSVKNRDYVLPGIGERVTVAQPQPRSGHMFVATLGRADLGVANAPVDAVLYEITTHRGVAAFERLEYAPRWSNAFYAVRALFLNNYPELAMETRRAIGPGGPELEVISEFGNGRFRVIDGLLYFSTSDNSSPTVDGRRYELVLVVRAVRIVAKLARFGALALFGVIIVASLTKRPVARRLLINTAPGVVIAVILVSLIVGAYEGYQRFNGRFARIEWPDRVDPVAGFIFEPNAEVRWTNHLDYWVAERTNSLGFLDSEPAVPKPSDRFRVLLVGDSFVEAAQFISLTSCNRSSRPNCRTDSGRTRSTSWHSATAAPGKRINWASMKSTAKP